MWPAQRTRVSFQSMTDTATTRLRRENELLREALEKSLNHNERLQKERLGTRAENAALRSKVADLAGTPQTDGSLGRALLAKARADRGKPRGVDLTIAVVKDRIAEDGAEPVAKMKSPAEQQTALGSVIAKSLGA